MNYIFNKEKLEQVLSDFYSSTDIAIALYDASERMVASAHAYSGCCSLIRSKEQCVKNCELSDLIHMKEVSKDRKILQYTCHAGLMETIFPIVYDDVLIAYLQIGQFRDEKQVYSTEKKLRDTAERYGLDFHKLHSLYGELSVISEEKLRAVCNIMEILIKSFWEDGLIAYNRSMVSIKIEQYIDSHLNEKIYLEDICQTFFLSKNAVYQLFRDEFGTTVNEFITQKKLRLAQKLLQSEPNLNVTQISAKCGFHDYNYFIRSFKKYVGMTPLKFRKTNKSRV